MNWATVCSGVVGIAALVIETDRERMAGMPGRVLSARQSFLDGFGEDGGCKEGISHWTYGFGYFVFDHNKVIWSGSQEQLLLQSIKNA